MTASPSLPPPHSLFTYLPPLPRLPSSLLHSPSQSDLSPPLSSPSPLPPSYNQVSICSTSLPHCEANGGAFTADTTLPGGGAGPISVAKTFITQSKSLAWIAVWW